MSLNMNGLQKKIDGLAKSVDVLKKSSDQLVISQKKMGNDNRNMSIIRGERKEEAQKIKGSYKNILNDVVDAVGIIGDVKDLVDFGKIVSSMSPAGRGITAVAAIAGGAAYGYYKGSKEQDEYNKSLFLSENKIGMTPYEMAEISKNVGKGGERYKAANAVNMLVRSGLSNSDNLELMTEAVVKISNSMELGIEEIAKDFSLIGNKPDEALELFRDKYGVVDKKFQNIIEILLKNKDEKAAINIMEREFSKKILKKSEGFDVNSSFFGKIEKVVKKGESWVVDSLYNLGRNDEFSDLDEKIIKSVGKINEINKSFDRLENSTLMRAVKISGMKSLEEMKILEEENLRKLIAKKVLFEQQVLGARLQRMSKFEDDGNMIDDGSVVGGLIVSSGDSDRKWVGEKGRGGYGKGEVSERDDLNSCFFDFNENKRFNVIEEVGCGGVEVSDDGEGVSIDKGKNKELWESIGSGLIDYSKNANDVFEKVSKTVVKAFDGMENALTSFVLTGKADFRSLADSIIQDMVRIMIQQSVTAPLAKGLGMLLGSFSPQGGVSGLAAASTIQDFGGDGIGFLIADNGWSSGGYTGAGGRYEPAGIVHRGEGVLNQDEIRAIGGEAGFNALRRAIRGPRHSAGGMAGIPALPPTASGSAGQAPVQVNIEINGADQQIQTQSSEGLEAFARMMGEIARAEYQKLQLRSYQGGGMAWQAQQGAFR